MPDREKVIKGLYACTTLDENGITDGECKICPYDKGYATGECWLQMNRDALALLKEQEAVKPIVYGTQFFCVCNCRISYGDNFCWHCGRKIQWEPIENYNIGKLKPVLMEDQHENKAWFCEKCGQEIKWK